MRKPTIPAAAVTEKQFTGQLMDLARTLGWAVYHPWLSIHSPRGWPDLALCKPPRLILAELKTQKGTLSEHQSRWIELLAGCPGVEVHVWRPADLVHIAETLQGAAVVAATTKAITDAQPTLLALEAS